MEEVGGISPSLLEMFVFAGPVKKRERAFLPRFVAFFRPGSGSNLFMPESTRGRREGGRNKNMAKKRGMRMEKEKEGG